MGLGHLQISSLDDGKSLITAGRRKFIVGAPAEMVAASLRDDRTDHEGTETWLRAHISQLLEQQPSQTRTAGVLRPEIHCAGVGALADKLTAAHRALPEDAAERSTWLSITLYLMDGDIPADEFERLIEGLPNVIPVVIREGELQLGPLHLSEGDSSYRDLLDRRLAVSQHVRLEQARRGAGAAVLDDYSQSFYVALLKVVSRTLADQSGRWSEFLRHGVLGIDLETFQVHPHPLLPVPRGIRTGSPKVGSLPVSHLIDSHNGVISRLRVIRHTAAIPRNLVTVQADVALTRRILPWANNGTCQGSAFDDRESARNAAVGESVERYCANILDSLPRLTGSWRQLTRSALRALDPERIILHSPSQYSAKGFPLVPLTRDLETDWVPGRSISLDHEVWVPASLVYVNYYVGDHARLPKTNLPSFPGIASGPSLDFAIVSGVEEVIERHATMCWWHNAITLPRLSLTDALLHEMAQGAERGQRLSAIALPNIFGMPVAAGILEHLDEQLLNIGFAARPSLQEAVKKAWTEAYTLQEGSRDLLLPDGAYRRAVSRGEIDGRSMKPVREDRLYLDSYRDDFHDVNDLMCQQQVYLDPRARDHVAHLIDSPETEPIAKYPSLRDRSLTTYREAVEARGYEIIAVDLTTDDVAACGMSVVRVIVPGLVPNFPAGFPHLGKMRLQLDPVELGLREAPLGEEELNYFPLPHA